MGCAPGSGCCSECGDQTGPPIGMPAVHVHQIPSERNSALRASLGAVNCDQDGNCYDDSTGTYTPAAVSSSAGSGVSNTTLYIAGAILLIGLLEATSRRR